MTTTFDFIDGRGPVPAHRHKNPDGTEGGWVADTARVSGDARVSGNAQVYGNAWVVSPVQMQIGRWHATCLREHVVIGCQRMTLVQWYEKLDDVAHANNATDFERALAESFLAMCGDLQADPTYGVAP